MKPMIFESHAHYDSRKFDEDREELLNSMQENGVGTIVNVGATWKSVTTGLELANQYPFVYAALGLHPDEVGDLNEERFAILKAECQKEKVAVSYQIVSNVLLRVFRSELCPSRATKKRHTDLCQLSLRAAL